MELTERKVDQPAEVQLTARSCSPVPKPLSPHSAINKQIQEIILQHLQKNPRLSLNSLSTKSGLANASLRRMVQNRTKTIPSISNVVTILSYILKCSHFRELIEKVDGELKTLLEGHFAFWGAQDLKDLDQKAYEKIVRLLTEKQNYHFYRLTQTRSGLSKQNAKRIFAEKYESIAQKLIKSGFIEEVADGFQAKNKSLKIPLILFKENFRSTAEYIRVNENGAQNLYTNLVEHINEAALSKILALQRETNYRVMSILQNENSRGDIPVFFLSAVDSY